MATVPSLALIPSAYKASKVYSVLPSNGDGDFTFTRPSFATRVNSNGLIESVGVNIPRLDYSDGNCPILLLEPQRTNLYLNSETLVTQSNVTTATTYTVTFYGVGSITFSGSYIGVLIGTGINDRVSLTFTSSAGTLISTVSGSVTNAQLEEGSYATSYIPTNGSIATRIVEACNYAGNASTFNDSEGVLFIEATALENGGVNRYITISNGTSNERLVINYESNSNRLTISAATAIGSVTPIFFTNFTQNQLNKIAIRYSSTDLTLFINGVKEETNTSNASFSPNSLNKLNLSNWNDTVPFFGKVKQLQYFDTALTDTELQELTTL